MFSLHFPSILFLKKTLSSRTSKYILWSRKVYSHQIDSSRIRDTFLISLVHASFPASLIPSTTRLFSSKRIALHPLFNPSPPFPLTGIPMKLPLHYVLKSSVTLTSIYLPNRQSTSALYKMWSLREPSLVIFAFPTFLDSMERISPFSWISGSFALGSPLLKSAGSRTALERNYIFLILGSRMVSTSSAMINQQWIIVNMKESTNNNRC